MFRNRLHAVSLSQSRNEIRGARPGQKDSTFHASFKLFSNRNPTSNHSESFATRVRIVGIEEKAGSGATLRAVAQLIS